MACGDRRPAAQGGLRPRVALLDPDLTRTQPRSVAAATGIDAITHAVETAGTRVRNDESMACSRAAWRLLSENLAPALENPNDGDARTAMLLGAHLAGAAIERSMLGAAHACANPLTARFGITHGVAVGLMAPPVVRFNAAEGVNPYAALDDDPERLARRLEELLAAAGVPRRLSECGISEAAIPELAEMAAEQWTAGFNPRPVGREELGAIYRLAL
jgi:alcohol dehydrogenase